MHSKTLTSLTRDQAESLKAMRASNAAYLTNIVIRLTNWRNLMDNINRLQRGVPVATYEDDTAEANQED